MKILTLVLTSALFSGIAIGADQYKLNAENTTVKFVGSKKDGKHEGTFKKLEGTLTVDEKDVPKSNLAVTIDIESISTDAEKLTSHLKSPDFFDAKKYPQAKFVSKTIKAGTEKDSYNVDGELTMHGKTHPVSFLAKAVKADGKATVTADLDIKRSHWGMNYGKDKVNDEVKLSLQVSGPVKQ